MTGRKDTKRESFWKKNRKNFQVSVPKEAEGGRFYGFRRQLFLWSSEYSSEEELEHFDDQKDRIAFTSSQARFVTPENKPTNLRYQLRQNRKPSLRAQEAQAQALAETRAKNNSKKPLQPKENTTKLKKIKISVPIVEPTAPPLEQSPILPPYEEDRPDSELQDSFIEEPLDQVVAGILQASGIHPPQYQANDPHKKQSDFLAIYNRAVDLYDNHGLEFGTAAQKALKEFHDAFYRREGAVVSHRSHSTANSSNRK